MAESVGLYEADSTIRYVNRATEVMTGRRADEMIGRRLWDLYPEAVGGVFHAAFLRVAAGGAAEVCEQYFAPLDRWFGDRIERVGERVLVVARDITDDVRRRRRLEALARISEVLTADDAAVATVLGSVAAVVAETIDADCTLALLSADPAWLEVAARSARDPEALALTRGVTRFPADEGNPGEALRTRTTLLADPGVVARRAAAVADPGLRAVVARYQPVSVLVAPLVAGDEPLGVVIATRRAGARPLTTDDRALVAEIAPSLGLYVAHARRRAETTTLRGRLAAVSDSNPALISFIDREERYGYVNAAYERWFDRPRSAFLGRRLEEVMGPDAYRVAAPRMREALGGRAVHYRAVVPYPSGARHVDAHYIPVRDGAGEIDGVAAIVLDVTAEARLAEHERRSTRRLESLLAVTAELAAADSPDAIARVAVDQGVAAIGADLGGLWRVDEGALVLQRQRGFSAAQVEAFARVPLAPSTPLTDCITTARPVWVESRADYVARYPAFEPAHRPAPVPPIAFAILPLVIEGQVAGCFNLTFHDERRLTHDERTYLEVLASHTAEALRRARLYAALRDASETREAMIQASPAAIMLLDGDGVVRSWNPAAERVFGWTAAEAVGTFLPSAGDRRDEVAAKIAAIVAGEVLVGHAARRRRKRGDWIDVEIYAAPVRLSDGRTLCLSMVVDVSERTRLERGRRLVTDAAAVLTRSLDATRSLDEVAALVDGALGGGCAIELDPAGAAPRRIVAGADPAVAAARVELPLRVGDRELGRLAIGVPRAADDVDRTIAAELASHLATALDNARLYAEARDARRDAEAASRAKDQFLAMLGHELRNPLAPITTALHLMALRAPDAVGRERAVIERQVAHLSRLVDDLLDVSRITRGKVELRRERTRLAAVVAKAIEITAPLLEQRRHQLTIEVPPDLAVHGDPVRLAQVVANLLSNAARYTEAAGHVEVRARRDGDAIVLVVRDDGVGIAAEILPTVFDLFVQAPQSSARTDGGLGLGLAIVRGLVELHGGRVVARSDGPGRGTELEVRLPAALAAADAPPPPPVVAPRAAVTRRILVVDDNADAADLLGEVLDAHGHEIRVALDGPSALRVAEEFRPEIAVLDLGLPVMDGYELAQRLRATPALAGLRLIAVTGYGQETDRARSRAAGFDAHLAKPVSVDQLVTLIERDAPDR